jgi:putative serine protease PepD
VEFDDGEDEGREDDGPLYAWLPPEDRLWRHPSEMIEAPTAPNPTIDVGAARATATLTRPAARVWTLALAAGLAGALFASGFFLATGISDRRTTVFESVVTPGTAALALSSRQSTATVGDWPAIAASLTASIVSVRVESGAEQLIGSGVLYAAARHESYIITAQDLLAGARRIEVSFSNGDTQSAHLVGSDPVSGIAVLSTSGDHGSIPLFGSVSNVEVAEEVLAVGTRLADSNPVVTGAVSGLDEEVDTSAADTTMVGMLELSGITVPGTSDGGALVDPEGEIIGIDTDITAVDPSAPDVAYAVPIDVAEHVARELLAGQHATHPWLGVDDATDLTAAPARALGVAGGAQVGLVDRDSPAAAVGLQANDVITAFDGQTVTSSGALVTLLSQCQPGERTTLTYFRQSKPATVPVTVGEQPAKL